MEKDKKDNEKVPEIKYEDLPEEDKKNLTKGFRSLQDQLKKAQEKAEKKKKKS